VTHSEECTEMVGEFEGYVPHAYQDPNGVWTIGFGHTQGVHAGTPACTRNQALGWLDIDLHTADDALGRLVKVPLNQHEWDALTSLVYNIGQGHFKSSSLLLHLNLKDKAEAAEHFMDWINTNGHPNVGLIRRRIKEKELFLK
jgi:lysozyme